MVSVVFFIFIELAARAYAEHETGAMVSMVIALSLCLSHQTKGQGININNPNNPKSTQAVQIEHKILFGVLRGFEIRDAAHLCSSSVFRLPVGMCVTFD